MVLWKLTRSDLATTDSRLVELITIFVTDAARESANTVNITIVNIATLSVIGMFSILKIFL